MPARFALPSPSPRPSQPEGRADLRVRDGAPIPFHDDAETSGVIPHRPTDAVPLKCRADILYPAHASGLGRVCAEDPKLITRERYIVSAPPVGGEGDSALHAHGVPALFSVMLQRSLRRLLFNSRQPGNSFGTGRVRNVLDVRPVVRPPSRA